MATETIQTGRRSADRVRRTVAAWERFVAGDDDVDGIPPVILISWHRSRDLYRVDPIRTSPPPAVGAGTGSLLHDSILTQLGGLAASVAERGDGALTTVTDGTGQILGAWGPRDILRRAADSHLAPLFTWSERATGTNGMGTALGRRGPVTVRGPEHWCAALHGWSCNGTAIDDPVSGEPIAVLNVSVFDPDLPSPLPRLLEHEVAPLRRDLRLRADRDGMQLVEAFVAAQAAAPGATLMVIDTAGQVVIANERARARNGQLPVHPAVDPGERWQPTAPGLRDLVREAVGRVQADHRWVGVADLDLLSEETTTFELRPIVSANGLIGLLLVGSDRPDGEPIGRGTRRSSGIGPERIVGIRDERLIILVPAEIRYAEASKHAVWLITDQGRVRAAGRGMDSVERELEPFGFLRVHRSYLVKVHRIREVERGFSKGTLTVSTQHHGREGIPVARRQAAELRRRLGI
ncbi:DNA-binding protein [Pseudonocardia asaccharolytica]|uniref:Fis family transcriptional regulator n=1 Tax=Pseudonocardia asaccharolytica DSM 44247 = NBRC 16224 TaxID=1123024 RepID=A0A511D290_9PSEU|nr:DNA-binding protein [Pseudonocardia asaccharolytica]GEL18902.1 Fis family transcriptional regulator [Pseudonocardia asaccharolytica DSM 44247 = NBRC 16224]